MVLPPNLRVVTADAPAPAPTEPPLRFAELVVTFAAALAFYAFTLAPTVVWGDSASISWRSWRGAFELGTAGDHPLFMIAGWLLTRFPGEVGRNVNFASALFAAMAVALVYRCARVIGVSRTAAATGAAALCVSHAFWLHAVIAEIYTANAFFVLAGLNLLLEWRRSGSPKWLAAAIATFVIGLSNHLVLATALPAWGVFALMVKRRAVLTRGLLIACAALVLAAAVVAVVQPPWLMNVFWKVWNGPPGVAEYLGLDFDAAATAKEAAYYVLFLGYQFPSLSLILGVVGAAVVWRRDRAAAGLLFATIAVNALMFVRHTVWPSASGTKYVFYIADYAVFAVVIAIGADACLDWVARTRTVHRRTLKVALVAVVGLVPPLLYAAMPSLTKMAGVTLAPARPLPYRDSVRFFLNPNKRGDYGARTYAVEALESARPNAVIFADHTPYAVLRYLQITEARRLDVLVPRLAGASRIPVRWMSDAAGQPRPIYIAALPVAGYYDLSGLTGEYDLVPAGTIIEVRPRPHK
jgi:hypothetical protein